MRIIELLKNSTAQFSQNYFHFHIGAIYNKQSTSTGELNLSKSSNVRSGIRTHAYKSRLRPERSALDHSAIFAVYESNVTY